MHLMVPELLDQFRRHLGGKNLLLARFGAVKQGPVLSHDAVEDLRRALEDVEEVRKLATGHEDKLAAGFFESFEGIKGRGLDLAMAGEGAIVIDRKCMISHGESYLHERLRATRVSPTRTNLELEL